VAVVGDSRPSSMVLGGDSDRFRDEEYNRHSRVNYNDGDHQVRDMCGVGHEQPPYSTAAADATTTFIQHQLQRPDTHASHGRGVSHSISPLRDGMCVCMCVCECSS